MLRLLTISLAVLTLSFSATAEDRTVSAQSVAPTQITIGQYAARFKLETWKGEAKAAGQSFPDYVRTGLKQKFAGKVIPAIVDPSGQIRMLDGHHKLTALRTIEREMGLKVPVRIRVVHDYRGQSFDAYAKHLVGVLGKGYFGPKPPRSAVAKVKSLPPSFDKLGDNPLRSVLGVVFTKSGLEGSWFSDYIQFHLGEKMQSSGLGKELAKQGLARADGSLGSNAAADPRVIKAVTRRLFSDPKLVSYLRKNIKPGTERTNAARALRAASQRHRIRNRLRAGRGNAATRGKLRTPPKSRRARTARSPRRSARARVGR